MSTYLPFEDGPRPLTDWLDDMGEPLPGHECGGTMLMPFAVDAAQAELSSGVPSGYVIQGEYQSDDGRAFLVMAVTRQHVEAHSDYRDVGGHLVYICQQCGGRHGKHSRSCGLYVPQR